MAVKEEEGEEGPNLEAVEEDIGVAAGMDTEVVVVAEGSFLVLMGGGGILVSVAKNWSQALVVAEAVRCQEEAGAVEGVR